MSIFGSRVITVLLVFGFAFLVGCGSTNLNMDVQAYPSQGKDVGNGKTFKIFLKNEQFPELEVALLNIVNGELKKKSFIYEENSPDFAVMIDFTNSLLKSRKKTESVYVATDRTRYDTCYAAGTSNLHQVSSADLNISTQYAGETQASVSLTESGKGHYTDIRLFIIDYKRLMEKQEIDVVWKGRVSNVGSKSELKKLAPHLIRELLDEFPTQSGKKSHRVVKIK